VTPKLAGLSEDTWQVPEPLTMGYGFDDGPNCSHNAFYDFLLNNSQKASMFYIGSSVIDWPLEAQRAIQDGHEICVRESFLMSMVLEHALLMMGSVDDRYLVAWLQYVPHSTCRPFSKLICRPTVTSFNSSAAFAELYYTIKAIKLVTGVTPRCWRPPYGDVDDRIRAIAHGLNLTTIIWGYDSNDWQEGLNGITDADVDGFYQQFVDNATSGAFNSVRLFFCMLRCAARGLVAPQRELVFPRIPASFPTTWLTYRLTERWHHAHARAQQLHDVQGNRVVSKAASRLQAHGPR
jgi:hypothetical protein